MRVTSKGQVTIPIEIRQQLGLFPETEVQFQVSGMNAVITRIPTSRSRGDSLIQRMRGKALQKLSTDEIMSMTRGE